MRGWIGTAVALGLLTGAVAAGLQAAKPAAAPPVSKVRYPDYGYLPGDYAGRTFKLSQAYPLTQQPLDAPTRRILSIDFTRDPRAYAEAVRRYLFEGNIHGGPVGEDFYFEDNKVRRWYNVPWEHLGPNGREGIHGLTTEGAIEPGQLSPQQKQWRQSYAIGFQNNQGGYLLGQIWGTPAGPRWRIASTKGFPVGTVIGKLLFTTAGPDDAPFLTNPLSWNAYVYEGIANLGDPKLPRRVLRQINLVQLDFMVRDDRAIATGGWVFGTFAYNGAMARPVLWDNLALVGVSWGNDPTVTSMAGGNPTPGKTSTNPDLHHVFINAADPNLPPQNLGFGLRLSGPVDNRLSSCQSCHQVAETPVSLAFVPQDQNGKPYVPGSPQWMRWFQDKPPQKPFTPGAFSLDNSWELSIALNNYLQANGNLAQELFKLQSKAGPLPHSLSGQRGRAPGTLQ